MIFAIAVENVAQPVHFVGCQEALPATPAIALDNGGGIGALGTVTVDLGLFEDHRENRCRRSAAAGVAWSEANHC